MTRSTGVPSIIRRGVLLGALTGLGVAALYSMALISFFLVIILGGAIITAPRHPADAAMMMMVGPAAAGFMLICAGFIGILPGTILGLFIGGFISVPIAFFYPRLTARSASLMGTVISGVIVLFIHLFLFWSDQNPTIREYIWLTIVPGILCTIAGGWVGWRLYLDVK